jgi:hypothetical protein
VRLGDSTLHVPSLAVSVRPTRAWPEITGGVTLVMACWVTAIGTSMDVPAAGTATVSTSEPAPVAGSVTTTVALPASSSGVAGVRVGSIGEEPSSVPPALTSTVASAGPPFDISSDDRVSVTWSPEL